MTHLHGNLQLCTKFEENVTNNLEDMSRTGIRTDGPRFNTPATDDVAGDKNNLHQKL